MFSIDPSGIIAFDEADRLAQFESSYTRLPTILDLASRMEAIDWLRLLGEWWSCCDNISQFADDLADSPFGELIDDLDWRLQSRHAIMTTEEQDSLAALPEIVTVWRGCYANNKRGMSWSLDKAVAAGFPFQNRYSQKGQPLLVRGTVSRDVIIILKLDRGEAEVVACDVKCLIRN